MWPPNAQGSNMGRMGGRHGLVAVAIDKDKNSQIALKWAIDNLLTKGQTVILIHVLRASSNAPISRNYAITDPNGALFAQKRALDDRTKELFLTFHCFCTRKDIQSFDVILEDTDVAKGITEYVAHTAIENLVLGASHHGFIRRLKTADVPTLASKLSPDFCTVYVISKSKISSVRNACRRAPFVSPIRPQIEQMEEQAQSQSQSNSFTMSPNSRPRSFPSQKLPKGTVDDTEIVKSSSIKGRGYNGELFGDFTVSDTDITFISSNRPNTDTTMPGILFDGNIDSSRTPRGSSSSETSLGSLRTGAKGSDFSSFTTDFSSSSGDTDDTEAEMRRLKLQLQRTMEMYSTACKEALNAKQTAVELNQWRKEEERRLEEARFAEEAARLAAQGKAKHRSATQNAMMSEMESEKSATTTSSQKSNGEELSTLQLRYRKYTIEDIEEATEYFAGSRKIAEGGYGPVFRCYLDHTPAAVKVLRPGATQGRAQFQQEIEVLSCMRHPHMVLLLGACPEYGCLVYELMSNGSLEYQLSRKGGTPPLSWQTRFRIAAEVATGLNFLHMTKPEPLVHRDLKPANILLDHNFVSKIGDVGLARIIPSDGAHNETEYCMTAAAGTFCYIDPEYQQTGMLGVKSDVYSLGIVLLQLLTAKPAMGLTYYVGEAIEKGTFAELLDPAVPDWPVEEALKLAKLALQCSELRKKDRPDLAKVVLPELCRLREFGEQNMNHFI